MVSRLGTTAVLRDAQTRTVFSSVYLPSVPPSTRSIDTLFHRESPGPNGTPRYRHEAAPEARSASKADSWTRRGGRGRGEGRSLLSRSAVQRENKWEEVAASSGGRAAKSTRCTGVVRKSARGTQQARDRERRRAGRSGAPGLLRPRTSSPRTRPGTPRDPPPASGASREAASSCACSEGSAPPCACLPASLAGSWGRSKLSGWTSLHDEVH